MRGKEDLFSRRQFICVCVFVPPSSVLQISQLCEELKGVESALNAPISTLRFVPPTYIYRHTSVSLSSLDLPLSHPFPPVFPTSSPETPSSLSFFSVEIVHITTEQMMFLYCCHTLGPLVLLLGNRPGWRFFKFYFIFSVRVSYSWMTGVHVEGRQKKAERK